MKDYDPINAVMRAVDADVIDMCGEAGMISLGELTARMEMFDADVQVIIDDNQSPGELHSYRGFYQFIAIEPSKEPMSAGLFQTVLRDAIGKTFEGYKGGDYKMTALTPVWVSGYGSCSEKGVTGVELINGKAVIITKTVEYK